MRKRRKEHDDEAGSKGGISFQAYVNFTNTVLWSRHSFNPLPNLLLCTVSVCLLAVHSNFSECESLDTTVICWEGPWLAEPSRLLKRQGNLQPWIPQGDRKCPGPSLKAQVLSHFYDKLWWKPLSLSPAQGCCEYWKESKTLYSVGSQEQLSRKSPVRYHCNKEKGSQFLIFIPETQTHWHHAVGIHTFVSPGFVLYILILW